MGGGSRGYKSRALIASIERWDTPVKQETSRAILETLRYAPPALYPIKGERREDVTNESIIPHLVAIASVLE
jgi:hypothetical protein